MLNLTVMPAAEAFNFGEVSISWYGVVIALAVLSGFIIALRLAKKKNLDQDHIYNLLVILTVVGVFGGRLVYVLIEWGYYRNNLIDLIKIWQGGLSIFGVILGALISLILYSHRKKISFFSLSDIVIVAAPLMQAIGRWGNFFNQELYGLPTGLPWGIFIDTEHRLPEYAGQEFYHPLFFYESILMLVLFIFLYFFSVRRRLKPGQLTLLYLLFFSVIRFSLDFIRLDKPSWGFLSVAQWVCLGVFIVAVFVWRRYKKGDSSQTLSK